MINRTTSLLSLTASAALLALTAACSHDNQDAALAPTTDAAAQQQKVEEAYPGQAGIIQAGRFSGQPIEYRRIAGDIVYEGDILLTPEQINPNAPQPESAGRNTNRWTGGVVYYTIDSNLPSQQRVTDAIAHWQTNTAIRFTPRTTQSNYVTFRVGSGCSSNIGQVGGRQYINLASGCSTGNTIHEIGHALGLFHEQTRNDRDTFVTINFQNIQAGYENNFAKYSAQGISGTDYGNLDFGSIMMYGSNSFSSNGQPTIVKKDGSTFNIQRSGLSSGDKAGIDAMY